MPVQMHTGEGEKRLCLVSAMFGVDIHGKCKSTEPYLIFYSRDAAVPTVKMQRFHSRDAAVPTKFVELRAFSPPHAQDQYQLSTGRVYARLRLCFLPPCTLSLSLSFCCPSLWAVWLFQWSKTPASRLGERGLGQLQDNVSEG